jgi:hypothetical protein
VTRTPLQLSRRGLVVASAALAAANRLRAVQTPVVATTAAFSERLGDLLNIAPLSPDAPGAGTGVAFTYVDLERQLVSRGIAPPVGQDLPAGFMAATAALPLKSNAFMFALTPEWWETFGFEPFAIGRSLEVGEPPERVSIYADNIGTEQVRSALLASGFQEIDQETGGSYLTFGESLSPDTPVGRMGVGSLNQAALGDDVVIFTRQEATIQHVTQVMAGYQPSMLELSGWSELMTTFADDTVGMIALYPAALASLGDVSAMRQVAFGVREGADDTDLQQSLARSEPATVDALPETRARVQVRIRYVDDLTARREAAAIPERWNEMRSALSQRPMTDLMLVEEAWLDDNDSTVVALDFRAKEGAGLWYRMIDQNDLKPFVPTE